MSEYLKDLGSNGDFSRWLAAPNRRWCGKSPQQLIDSGEGLQVIAALQDMLGDQISESMRRRGIATDIDVSTYAVDLEVTRTTLLELANRKRPAGARHNGEAWMAVATLESAASIVREEMERLSRPAPPTVEPSIDPVHSQTTP